LGKGELQVGRSHECDWPAEVLALPQVTWTKFNPDGRSYEIDQRVKSIVEESLSVYGVNSELLEQLKPDVIITQDHCQVCAVSLKRC
jgi:iron complex transport system substrate-binding protein